MVKREGPGDSERRRTRRWGKEKDHDKRLCNGTMIR